LEDNSINPKNACNPKRKPGMSIPKPLPSGDNPNVLCGTFGAHASRKDCFQDLEGGATVRTIGNCVRIEGVAY